MKYLQLLFFLFSGFLFSQNLKKIKVIDSQDSKPISNVRLLFSNEVVYSNDDGFALIPENVKNLETSKSGYQTEKLNKVSEIISLTPLYQDIEEVKIVNIDVKKIFKDVSNRYSEIYYDKSAIYDVTFKQRAFENNDMKLLMIAHGKFWSRDGSYNSKEAFNNKFDNFVQLQIDDLRYLKSKPYENFIKVKKQDKGHDYIGSLFFSYELFNINRFIGFKKSLTTGRLIHENKEEQEISFSIKTDQNLLYRGRITYNKKDKAITYYEMNFRQSNFPPEKMKDENGKEKEITEELKSPIVSYFNVFNAEQIENIPENTSSNEIFRNNELAEKLINNSEAKINYVFTDNAYYSRYEDKIIMPNRKYFKTEDDFYSVIFHEMAHSTGHESRLNREMHKRRFDKKYSKEELIAEISSMFLQLELGIEINNNKNHFENHKAYIKHYIELLKETPNILFSIIREAEKASDYILNFAKK